MITEQKQNDGTTIFFKRVSLHEGIKYLMEKGREVKIWGKYSARIYKHTNTIDNIPLLLSKSDYEDKEWKIDSIFIDQENLAGNSAEICLTEEEYKKEGKECNS